MITPRIHLSVVRSFTESPVTTTYGLESGPAVRKEWVVGARGQGPGETMDSLLKSKGTFQRKRRGRFGEEGPVLRGATRPSPTSPMSHEGGGLCLSPT